MPFKKLEFSFPLKEIRNPWQGGQNIKAKKKMMRICPMNLEASLQGLMLTKSGTISASKWIMIIVHYIILNIKRIHVPILILTNVNDQTTDRLHTYIPNGKKEWKLFLSVKWQIINASGIRELEKPLIFNN